MYKLNLLTDGFKDNIVMLRLSHTLMLVQNLHWVVVEDAEHKSTLVTKLLASTGLNYTHLSEPTPPQWKTKPRVRSHIPSSSFQVCLFMSRQFNFFRFEICGKNYCGKKQGCCVRAVHFFLE